MALRTLGDIEKHAFFILFISFIIILFWHAVWELLTELTDSIHQRYGIKKWKIYSIYLLIILLIIGVYPRMLEKM